MRNGSAKSRLAGFIIRNELLTVPIEFRNGIDLRTLKTMQN